MNNSVIVMYKQIPPSQNERMQWSKARSVVWRYRVPGYGSLQSGCTAVAPTPTLPPSLLTAPARSPVGRAWTAMALEENAVSNELFKDVKFYVVGDIDQKVSLSGR